MRVFALTGETSHHPGDQQIQVLVLWRLLLKLRDTDPVQCFILYLSANKINTVFDVHRGNSRRDTL